MVGITSETTATVRSANAYFIVQKTDRFLERQGPPDLDVTPALIRATFNPEMPRQIRDLGVKPHLNLGTLTQETARNVAG